MGLETATYISDLVVTNPAAGDPVSQGDDHLRLVKTVLQTQFPDSANGPIYGLRAASVQASTSGTSIDFTSIPSWVKRITINFASVSTSGTSNPLIQLGDSGGVEATGYLGSGTGGADAAAPSVAAYTTGFGLNGSAATNSFHGSMVISLLDASTNTWAASGNFANYVGGVGAFLVTAGSKSLSATLDRVRITTVGGTDTFDAGKINILYE